MKGLCSKKYIFRYYIPVISVNSYFAYVILRMKKSQNYDTQIKNIINELGFRLNDPFDWLIPQVVISVFLSLVVFFVKGIVGKKEIMRNKPKVGRIKLFFFISILSFITTFPIKHILNILNAPTELGSFIGIMFLFIIPVCSIFVDMVKRK